MFLSFIYSAAAAGNPHLPVCRSFLGMNARPDCHRDNTNQVSWIRRQDYKLLTVGQENLSSDERFVSDFGRHLGLASLRIKNVRDSDKGLYECQLSSYPPQSLFVQLKISGMFVCH